MAKDDLLPLIAGRDVAAVADRVLRDFAAYAGQVCMPRAALAAKYEHGTVHGSRFASSAVRSPRLILRAAKLAGWARTQISHRNEIGSSGFQKS